MRTLLAIALTLPALSLGQPYDPSFRWRTLETEHFQVHFHEGEEALAQRTAREAERAHDRLGPLLQYSPPERTQIVLSDDSDDANGSAMVVPYSTIRLFAVAPPGRSELSDARDWLQTLVHHEYVHVLQMENAGGVPAAFNGIFGKLWVPNGLLPPWAIEGIAVLHESGGDPATGRNAGALHDMYARALVTEPPGLPSLNAATHPSLDWPTGRVPYLLGGKLMEYLQQTYGGFAIPTFVAEQGTRIWPWAPSGPARLAFGKPLSELWQDFGLALAARYERQLAEVRRRAVTQPQRLTRRGAQAENPRWSPDGGWIAWLDGSLDERSGIRCVSPTGAELGLASPVDAGGSFALRSATEAIVSAGEIWSEYRFYEDLWRLDLETGVRRRLTDGERATDPDVRPAGDAVVYVARLPGGEMALRRRRLAGGPAETLLQRPGALLGSPRLSPDGTTIAFELHEGGRRDLALLCDGKLERITDDDALDLDPAWSPDGRWLFFASDRGGIFNLYARGSDGVVKQVTNVETGALEPEPSPDGRTLAFVTYSRDGHDLGTVPLEPESWLEPLAAAPAPAWTAPDDGAPLPSRPYSSFPTVLPHWWLPYLGADASGLTLGARTSGQDVLARHTWAAQGWYSFASGQLGYSASYLGGWSWPALDASSVRRIAFAQGLPYQYESEWTPLNLGATFTFTRIARRLAVRVGWIGTLISSLGDPATTAPFPPERAFRDGFLSAGSITLGWSNARLYRRSISAEEGTRAHLELQVARRETASDFETERLRAAVAGFLRVPATRHAVLAARLSGGAARGTIGGRAPFRLGGLYLSEGGGVGAVRYATAGEDELRGYGAGSVVGSGFVLGNLEARFPIIRPEIGRTTWPIFLRRLHGALFVDAGDAFDVGENLPAAGHRLALESILFGAGAELRLELFLGYQLPLELRLGIAHGLGPLLAPWEDGAPQKDPRATTQGYVTLGPAF